MRAAGKAAKLAVSAVRTKKHAKKVEHRQRMLERMREQEEAAKAAQQQQQQQQDGEVKMAKAKRPNSKKRKSKATLGAAAMQE